MSRSQSDNSDSQEPKGYCWSQTEDRGSIDLFIESVGEPGSGLIDPQSLRRLPLEILQHMPPKVLQQLPPEIIRQLPPEVQRQIPPPPAPPQRLEET